MTIIIFVLNDPRGDVVCVSFDHEKIKTHRHMTCSHVLFRIASYSYLRNPVFNYGFIMNTKISRILHSISIQIKSLNCTTILYHTHTHIQRDVLNLDHLWLIARWMPSKNLRMNALTSTYLILNPTAILFHRSLPKASWSIWRLRWLQDNPLKAAFGELF